MENVLTLIAGRDDALSDDMVAAIRQGLKELGAHVAAPKWLSPARVCDLAFGHLAPEQADAAARQRLGRLSVDVVAQPLENRRKLLLVADMDSTVVVGETLDELAEYAGIKDRIAAITARAMNGEIGFEAALRERIGLMAGLPETALADTWAKTVLMPGARKLVQTMKANGALRCWYGQLPIYRKGGGPAASTWTWATASSSGTASWPGGRPIGARNQVGHLIAPPADANSAAGGGGGRRRQRPGHDQGGRSGVAYQAKPMVAAEAASASA